MFRKFRTILIRIIFRSFIFFFGSIQSSSSIIVVAQFILLLLNVCFFLLELNLSRACHREREGERELEENVC